MSCPENITSLKGIGEKTARLFNRLGIYDTGELLSYYPRSYETFEPPVKLANAPTEKTVTLELFLLGDFKWKKVNNRSIGTGLCSDGENKVSITYFNAPYLKKKLCAGSAYLFRGKLKPEGSKYRMDQPKLYTREEYQEVCGRMLPCYGLTAGLTNKAVMKAA